MVRRVHAYADGGKVVKDHTTTPIAPKPTPPMRNGVQTGDSYQINKPSGPVDAIKNTRKRQEEDLGLRDGGSVSKFDQLSAKLAKRPGVTNPDALAAAIGRKKYGAKGMAAKAAAGRKKG